MIRCPCEGVVTITVSVNVEGAGDGPLGEESARIAFDENATAAGKALRDRANFLADQVQCDEPCQKGRIYVGPPYIEPNEPIPEPATPHGRRVLTGNVSVRVVVPCRKG